MPVEKACFLPRARGTVTLGRRGNSVLRSQPGGGGAGGPGSSAWSRAAPRWRHRDSGPVSPPAFAPAASRPSGRQAGVRSDLGLITVPLPCWGHSNAESSPVSMAAVARATQALPFPPALELGRASRGV